MEQPDEEYLPMSRKIFFQDKGVFVQVETIVILALENKFKNRASPKIDCVVRVTQSTFSKTVTIFCAIFKIVILTTFNVSK